MEVAGAVLRQAPCFSSSGADAFNSRHYSFPTMKPSRSFRLKQTPNVKSLVASAGLDEFSDKSHLQYYNGPKMAVKEKEIASKKKDMKKKLKLLKGLSKNLSTFSDMGFGLNPDDGLDHQVKGQMISEATEVLLGQLQKLKAEEMESKRKKKEEKAKKKAAKMMMVCNEESSSSESSCSSESDCENVVDMKQLKTVTTPEVVHQELTPSVIVTENATSNPGNVLLSVDEGSNKIEVCMGGKCKKSGAAMLLENFQKAVGGEAAVVGCKCMGKCRDAPNVRVRTGNTDGNGDPLCIGVGLEDVDSIVTSFFGGSRSCSDIVPALSGV